MIDYVFWVQADVPRAGQQEHFVPAAGLALPLLGPHALRVPRRAAAAPAAALRAHALQQEAVLAQHGRSVPLVKPRDTSVAD